MWEDMGLARAAEANLFRGCPSERADWLVPFFNDIKHHYGAPVALVHDMGKGILSAVSTVFPGIPDFICHFHFLRDIGKDLLDPDYSKIRNRESWLAQPEQPAPEMKP